jgi:hypothetical protein
MIRYLGLYAVAFVGLLVGTYTPSLSILTPISTAVLFFGAIGLWLLDKRSFRDPGFPKASRWPLQLALSTVVGLGMVVLFVVILLLTRMVTLSPGHLSYSCYGR